MMKITPKQVERVHRLVRELCANCDEDGNCILSQAEGLTPEVIVAVMSEEKDNQREMFKVPMERIRQYVPNANAKQAEDFVLKACKHYRKFLIRQRNRDER